MKKILVTLALLAGALQILSAIPAYPGKIKVTQPDGSVITIRIHGDEWLHYITDESGRVVAQDADGFYRPAEMPTAAQLEEAMQMRRAARALQAQARASSHTQGAHRIPVVLVEFSDRAFTISDPREAFSNLLNQEGYSRNGATGSVRDFYIEQSHEAYQPTFEVFGPVTLSNTGEYYAYNKTGRASAALREACTLLDDAIDFTQYDSDNDGSVDMILMYYAGHNQAEGGGTDTIWPHQGYSGGRYDGKSLSRYFCTSELKGATGRTMCGIGTTTHEFAHSLGLPDFYDTDYETNGSAGGVYTYSTMCSGSYLNDGRTPPNFGAEERIMLGWMDGLTEIMAAGDVTVEPITENVAYKTAASATGEYFLYECRKKTGWDQYLPGEGLLVYHVDKSAREIPIALYGNTYNISASELWSDWSSYNSINANGSHPCYYLVPAAAQTSLNYGNESYIPFPGGRKVTSYTPVDWDGEEGEFRFSNIAYDGNHVTMTAKYAQVPGITGIVRNMAAKPVRGATVSLYRAESASAPAQNAIRRKVQGQALMSATTDAGGNYSFEDESLADGTFTLVVNCDGYVESTATVQIGRRIETQDFYIRKVDESTESTFIKYDPAGSFNGLGYGDTSKNLAAALHLTAEEATAYAGKQIKLISFQPYGSEETTAEAVYVFIEAGKSRIFTQKVDNVRFDAMNTVNVTGQEFYVPSGTELYIGYGIVGGSEAYPILTQACTEENAGYMATFNQNRANSWGIMQTSDGTMFTPVISASVGEPVQPELGFNHIANPGNGTYAAGDRFSLELVRYEDDAPSSVSWTFDGQAVQADAVTLSAGPHTVEAHLTYPDGSVEVIRLVVTAE